MKIKIIKVSRDTPYGIKIFYYNIETVYCIKLFPGLGLKIIMKNKNVVFLKDIKL